MRISCAGPRRGAEHLRLRGVARVVQIPAEGKNDDDHEDVIP
jgi:hypothetical protein